MEEVSKANAIQMVRRKIMEKASTSGRDEVDRMQFCQYINVSMETTGPAYTLTIPSPLLGPNMIV